MQGTGSRLSKGNQTRRKAGRTGASLLIDFSPPRVWMEALEARTLLSGPSAIVGDGYFSVDDPMPPPVVMTLDGSVRAGYFRQVNTSAIWGDSTHVSGTLATFIGDAPKVDRAYIRHEADWRVEGSVDSRWIPVTFVDVPGPTFEIYGEVPAGTATRDTFIHTTFALLNDHGRPSYLFGGPKLVFSDHDFISPYNGPYTEAHAWEWNMSRLYASFYDRVQGDRTYHVLVQWLDGSASELFEVSNSGGSFAVVSSHDLKLGTAYRMTVTAEGSTDSATFNGDVSLEALQPSTPSVPRPQPEYAQVTRRDIHSGETFEVLAEFTTPHFLADGDVGEVDWWGNDKTEPARAKLLSTGTDATTGATLYRYALQAAPRSLQAGSYYYEFKFGDDANPVIGYQNMMVLPDGLAVPFYNAGTPSSVYEYEGEQRTDGYDGYVLWDELGHTKAEYTAYFEFPDGQRGPAFVEGGSIESRKTTYLSVQPAFALWNPLTSTYSEDYAATLVISRAGSAVSQPVNIRVQNTDWIRPGSEDALEYAGLPQRVEITVPPYAAFRGPDVLLTLPVTVLDPALLASVDVKIDWNDDTASKGLIRKQADGTYVLEAAHHYDYHGYAGGFWNYCHIDATLLGKTLVSRDIQIYTGDDSEFFLSTEEDEWTVPSDVDWGGRGVALPGPTMGIFGVLDGPVTADIAFDDNAIGRVFLKPSTQYYGEGVIAFDTYLQTELPSEGTYNATLTIHAGSRTLTKRIEVYSSGRYKPEYLESYITSLSGLATPNQPIAGVSELELNAFEFGEMDYHADTKGNVRLTAPLLVADAGILARAQFRIDWGDGTSSPVTLSKDAEGKWQILADHHYAKSGSHELIAIAVLNGTLIEYVRMGLSASDENGVAWFGNPNYWEVASGIDWGRYDLSIQLPVLRVFEHIIKAKDVQAVMTFDDGSPNRVMFELTKKHGATTIDPQLEVYFENAGRHWYTFTCTWPGGQANIRGYFDASPYDEAAMENYGGVEVDLDDGHYVMIPWDEHGGGANLFGNRRPLKPGTLPDPGTTPDEPVVPAAPANPTPEPDFTVPEDADVADSVPPAWGVAPDATWPSGEDWSASFFNDDDEVERDNEAEWLTVIE